MGNTSSDTSGNDRTDRFIQNPQNGILMYNKGRVADMKAQFESARPNSLKAIMDELENDLNLGKNNFKKFWARAQESFAGNPNKYRNALKMSGGKNFPDECHIALICYTMGYQANSVYAKFNEECRSVCGGSLKFSQIANKSMFFLFRYVMENKDESSGGAVPAKLYRGCTGKFTASDKEEILSFGMFTSTTAKSSTGEGFATDYGTIFEINKAGGRNVKTRGINMRYHSQFPSEEEYLLSPFQLYRITNVERNGYKTTVYLDLI